MQMVAAYSAIANGGILRAPHVVQAVGGKPTAAPAGPPDHLGDDTASELRDMLRGVLADGGTASGAGIPGYDMAGKTGTANIAINGHYSDSAYVASFIGMVPADHPRLRGRRGRRPAAGLDLRRLGGGAGVPEDRRLGRAVPGDPADASRRRLGRAGPRGRRPELGAEHREPLVPLAADLGHPTPRRTAAPA